MSAASPPTTGHLTTPSTPHWPAHVSDSCPSNNMLNRHKTSFRRFTNEQIIYSSLILFIVDFCLSTLCQPAACDCQSEFTDGTCEDLTGRCFCKPNYSGENCESCASGFMNFPDCYREFHQQKHLKKPV